MGKKVIVIIDEQEDGADITFKFKPDAHKSERSFRIYLATKIMRMFTDEQRKIEEMTMEEAKGGHYVQ